MRYCCVFVMFAPRQVYLGVTGRQKRDVIRAAHRAETDHGGWMVIKYDISSFFKTQAQSFYKNILY